MDSYKIIRSPASELTEQYRPMVYSKFLRSNRHGNDWFKLIDQDAYYSAYRSYIASLLARPLAMISLAVLFDDPDVVLGWALTENKILHFVYVNKDNRQIGVARALIRDPFDTFTHLTKTGLFLWQSKFLDAVFNPFA